MAPRASTGRAVSLSVLIGSSPGAQAIALDGHLDDLGVREEAIQNGCRRGHVAEEDTPVLGGPVRGNDRGRGFVTPDEDFEQILGGGGAWVPPVLLLGDSRFAVRFARLEKENWRGDPAPDVSAAWPGRSNDGSAQTPIARHRRTVAAHGATKCPPATDRPPRRRPLCRRSNVHESAIRS